MELIDNKILNKVKAFIHNFAEEIRGEGENDKLFDALISNWNSIENLFLDFNKNYEWPMSKCNFLIEFDLKKNTMETHIKRLTGRGRLKKGEDYVVESTTGPRAATYVYEKGAIKILEKSQSIEGAKYLSKLGKPFTLHKCFLYTEIIQYALRGFDNPKKEFPIYNPNYRIDLYLEQSKLPIECDELGHRHESSLDRNDREEAIRENLGCKPFLRFNPHCNDFNIDCFLEVIFCSILNKTINGSDPIEYWNKLTKKEKPINLDEFC